VDAITTLDDLECTGRRVLVRADLNLPMIGGRVSDALRIERLAPTVGELCDRRARVIVISHLGRPGGKVVPALSLRPVIGPLAAELGRPVAFAGDCVGPEAERAVAALGGGEVLLLENLRFHPGEAADDAEFARALATLADAYVNDAFSCAHRAHASIHAIARLLPSAAGRGFQAELDRLEQVLERPARPLAAVVGGAKVAGKLALLANLSQKVDLLAIGGGMANTFLHALGVAVGRSLCEREAADTVRHILDRAKRAECDIVLPTDAVVAAALAEGVESAVVAIKAVPADRLIVDVGPATAEHLARRLGQCRTCVWNGPLGAFEIPPFDAGTTAVARAAARLTRAGRLITVAGGGDTVAALRHAGVVEDFSYVSTAGGAFLEWLEGKELPGIAALKQKSL
jgi:phosphoglycerate kinase